VRPLGLYLGLLITRYIRIRRTLRIERREIRCDFNKDICYFKYPLNRAIDRKKSITLDRENLIVKC
jgi:hypothetical protein